MAGRPISKEDSIRGYDPTRPDPHAREAIEAQHQMIDRVQASFREAKARTQFLQQPVRTYRVTSHEDLFVVRGTVLISYPLSTRVIPESRPKTPRRRTIFFFHRGYGTFGEVTL